MKTTFRDFLSCYPADPRDLFDDLTGREIAREFSLPARAEHALDLASKLSRKRRPSHAGRGPSNLRLLHLR